jgi:hypothetical protein
MIDERRAGPENESPALLPSEPRRSERKLWWWRPFPYIPDAITFTGLEMESQQEHSVLVECIDQAPPF